MQAQFDGLSIHDICWKLVVQILENSKNIFQSVSKQIFFKIKNPITIELSSTERSDHGL